MVIAHLILNIIYFVAIHTMFVWTGVFISLEKIHRNKHDGPHGYSMFNHFEELPAY